MGFNFWPNGINLEIKVETFDHKGKHEIYRENLYFYVFKNRMNNIKAKVENPILFVAGYLQVCHLGPSVSNVDALAHLATKFLPNSNVRNRFSTSRNIIKCDIYNLDFWNVHLFESRDLDRVWLFDYMKSIILVEAISWIKG